MAGHVAAVVPAAGSGSRMGAGVPKQLRLLGGVPVLVRTLRAFAGHPAVDALVVAVAPFSLDVVRRLLDEHGVAATVTAGGATRQDSVRKALAAVPEGTGLVLVHDAVRPFVAPEQIAAVVAAARADGAAALAVPVTDTLRRVAGGAFGETVEREGLWRMQTPQAARLDWLRDAHEAAARDGFTGTDDVELLQRAGRRVRLVEGDARNLKLTHPADWALAEALWERWVKGD
ncbi:MAG TPA: 2-C-methyl-D-erythritol 4-phosphate cytidylyltransferase [Rubricoccaceae bacterium]|nr:2-C-methyl-D-erythritol 4-phosphate cytidylyltransferase [Rubricoccaceae bacterium]